MPHPILARHFIELHADDDALARAKNFEKLAKRNPNHPESHLLLASGALDAKLWGAARGHLQAALEARQSAGIYRKLAQLEEAENSNSDAARLWLLEASNARPDPFWVCTDCGVPASDWSLACSTCGALDKIEWRQPAAAPAALETRSESLAGATKNDDDETNDAMSSNTGSKVAKPA